MPQNLTPIEEMEEYLNKRLETAQYYDEFPTTKNEFVEYLSIFKSLTDDIREQIEEMEDARTKAEELEETLNGIRELLND